MDFDQNFSPKKVLLIEIWLFFVKSQLLLENMVPNSLFLCESGSKIDPYIHLLGNLLDSDSESDSWVSDSKRFGFESQK